MVKCNDCAYSKEVSFLINNGMDKILIRKCNVKENKYYGKMKPDYKKCTCYKKQEVIIVPFGGKGEVSDGYHTFNELYHHRALLFSVICNSNKEMAWKSKKHHDGTMYKDMFVVGIETPQGQATYHYDVNPYWDMFNVRECEQAPEWDGHTPTDAINRIFLLGGTAK